MNSAIIANVGRLPAAPKISLVSEITSELSAKCAYRGSCMIGTDAAH